MFVLNSEIIIGGIKTKDGPFFVKKNTSATVQCLHRLIVTTTKRLYSAYHIDFYKKISGNEHAR